MSESNLSAQIIDLCKRESPNDIIEPMMACLIACGSMALWLSEGKSHDQRAKLNAMLQDQLAEILAPTH